MDKNTGCCSGGPGFNSPHFTVYIGTTGKVIGGEGGVGLHSSKVLMCARTNQSERD